MNIDGDRLLTFQESQKRLECGSTTLYTLLQSGSLRGRKIHNRWRVAEGDITRFLKQQTDNRRRII